MRIVTGIFYSLLPKEWRRHWQPESTIGFERAAILSGLLEILLFGSLLMRGFAHFIVQRVAQMDLATGGEIRRHSITTEGYVVLLLGIEYLLRPQTIALTILTLEGALRAISAWAVDEVLPSLPLKLVALGILLAHGRRRSPNAAIVDEVLLDTENDIPLQIFSSRDKGWQIPITVEFDGHYYELIGCTKGDPDRPFRYLLRPLSGTSVIRRLVHYSGTEDVAS